MLVDVDSALVPLHVGSVIVLALLSPPQDTLLFGGPAKLQRKGSAGVPQVEDGCHYNSTRTNQLYLFIYCKTNIHLTRIVPRLRLYLCIHIIYTHVVRQGNHFWKLPFWTLDWHHPSIIRHPQPVSISNRGLGMSFSLYLIFFFLDRDKVTSRNMTSRVYEGWYLISKLHLPNDAAIALGQWWFILVVCPLPIALRSVWGFQTCWTKMKEHTGHYRLQSFLKLCIPLLMDHRWYEVGSNSYELN